MKAYILYIATLLAALALPANGQNGGIETRWAPNEPAMPYKFSLVTTGGNNGTVAVEDNKANGGGVIFPEKDTLVYGSSSDVTTTIVKLTVTPNTGYIIRKGYPKAYKTGETEELEYFFTDDASPYIFEMRAHPMTIALAYATAVTKVADVTLKTEAATSDAALALLPACIHVTLANGRKDSLKLASPGGWAFKASGSTGDGTATYDAKPGAVNRFTATLADSALPDSIDKGDVLVTAGKTYTTTILVANKAEVLKPTVPDKDLVISGGTGDNLSGNTGDGETGFNGTIEDANVKSLEVDGSVQDATLTLKGVTVSDSSNPDVPAETIVKPGADVTLRLEGTNTLGTLTVDNGASVVLDKAEGAKLEGTTVSNSGTFRDSTATLTSVTGNGALEINGTLSGGGSVTTNTKVTLTASTTDKAGITSFIWQKLGADGSYTVIQKKNYKADDSLVETPVRTKAGEAFEGIKDTFEPATSSNGTTKYRCLIERTVTTPDSESKETTAITLLSTQPAEVEVKSGSTPPVIPTTYYTVTLPALEGFTSNPAPGQHSVEEGNSFSFSLTPAQGSTAPAPVVTTSRGETLQPRESDGKYVITGIYENITVSLASLPTANEAIGAEAIRIQSVPGAVYIQTPQPATAIVYTLSGHPLKQLSLPAGDTRIELSEGFYIIRIGDINQKVIVR